MIEREEYVVEADPPRFNPRRGTMAWTLFGLFGFAAGLFGWYLGGDSYLGIAVTGTSLALFLYSLARYLQARRFPWYVSSLRIDVGNGLLEIEERSSNGGPSRRTPFGLAGVFEDVELRELRALRKWLPIVKTDAVYLRLPMSMNRATAQHALNRVRRAASTADEQGSGLVPPKTSTFDVERRDESTVIRWDEKRQWTPVLRVLGQVSLLLAATPLLQVAYGVPFGLWAAFLGWRFSKQLPQIGPALNPVRRIEIARDAIHAQPSGPTRAIADLGDVDLATIRMGVHATIRIDGQVDRRLDESMDPEKWIDAALDGESATPADMAKVVGAVAGGAHRAMNDTNLHWGVTLTHAGFAEGLELVLLIRAEMKRVADWSPRRDLRPRVGPFEEE